jgi:hypothetical protein
MLFVLFINSLNRLLAKAKGQAVLRPIAPRQLGTFVSYADDVVIFCYPDEMELRAIHAILGLFGVAPRLHANFAKCSVSPIACSDEDAPEATEVKECLPIGTFPRQTPRDPPFGWPNFGIGTPTLGG